MSALPSGLRLGTPAMTTRGLDEVAMEQVADWIKRALTNQADKKILETIRAEVRDFASQYPLPGID